MTDTAQLDSRYVICVSTAGEVFPAVYTERRSTDGDPRDSAWAAFGSLDDDPNRCLMGLVTAGYLPQGSELGRWHKTADAEVAGYWTVEAPA